MVKQRYHTITIVLTVLERGRISCRSSYDQRQCEKKTRLRREKSLGYNLVQLCPGVLFRQTSLHAKELLFWKICEMFLELKIYICETLRLFNRFFSKPINQQKQKHKTGNKHKANQQTKKQKTTTTTTTTKNPKANKGIGNMKRVLSLNQVKKKQTNNEQNNNNNNNNNNDGCIHYKQACCV